MRRYLTPKQRKTMWDSQQGNCAVCGAHTSLSRMIAEHWTPVALGNTTKPDCLLCIPCADRKTNGSPATSYGSDKHAIAKVRRLRGETKTGPKKRIASRPFSTPPEGYSHWPKRQKRMEGRPMKREAGCG